MQTFSIMNSSRLNSLVSKVVSKEVLDKNQSAVEYFDKYKKMVAVYERTSAALGRRIVYKTSSSSSINGKININANFTTH